MFLYNDNDLFESNEVSVYWKDRKGRYLDINKRFIESTHLHSQDEIIGHTDQSLLWKEQSEPMMSNDQHIVRSRADHTFVESAYSISVISLQRKVNHYLSYKKPIFSQQNKKKLLGIFGISLAFPANFKTAVNLELDKVSANASSLSKQQMKCLYHHVLGRSMKHIAKIMNLSPKTVEHYLHNIKVKLNCKTRHELVTAALKIPEIKNGILNFG